MKFYQLIWGVLIVLLLSSCGKDWLVQEPLEGVPLELKKGVLETGPEQFSNFEDFIVGEMVRLTLNNKSASVLKFKEGKKGFYKIQLRLLGGFDSKYEILDLENPFSNLTGSEWVYDSGTKTGELRWTPDRAFNQGAFYKRLNFEIPIQLRKKAYPREDSRITVLEKLGVLVDKNTYHPEVIGVQTKYKSYIKLDDDRFYDNTYINSLNLDYYNKIFAKKSKKPKNSENPAPKQKPEINPNNILHKNTFEITDEKEEKVPYSLFSYMKRPYYEIVQSAGRSDCAAAHQDEALCWIVLENIENLSFEKQVYIRNYVVPKNLDLEKLYYKISSEPACSIYNSAGGFYRARDSVFRSSIENSGGRFCYLSLNQLGILRGLYVSESHSIHLLEGDELRPLEVTNWEESFKEIPLSVKFQLSGQEPVKNINISYMNAGNKNRLTFKIKDENKFVFPPNVYFENIEKQTASSLLPFQFKFESVKETENSLFELAFSFDVKAQEKFKVYNFKITPHLSGLVKGDSVSFKVAALPSILRELEYSFNFESNLTAAERWKKIEEYAGEGIGLQTQVKRRYIFPKSFYENLKNYSSGLDIKTFKERLSFKEITAEGRICNTKINSVFLNGRDCSCSEENFYKDEKENIYMESVCSLSAQFHLLPSHVQDNISGYVRYDYDIKDQSLSFLDFDFSSKKKIHRKASIHEKSYFAGGRPAGNLNQQARRRDLQEDLQQDFQQDLAEELSRKEINKNEDTGFNTLHLFFNLKPSWKCETSSDDNKKNCSIKYPSPDMFHDKEEKSYKFKGLKEFLEQEVLADLKCHRKKEGAADFNQEYECGCSDLNFSVLRGFELRCGIDSEALLELRLKTEHPRIYFFSLGGAGNKQTPLERIHIN